MAIIVGHRGAAGYAPENTLLSFQKAIDIGCQKTELDVRLSKDKAVIVIHDADVKRTTDGQGLVSKMNLAKLKELNCPHNQKLPTLQEVIDVCKDKIDLQIELKSKGTPGPVNELIFKNKILNRITITSFDINLLKEIKNINPQLKVCYLLKRYSANIWDYIKAIPLEYLGLRSRIVKEKMVEHAHQLGIKVYAFQLNNEVTYKKLVKMGVDEIGTDFPKLFINY